MNAPKHETRCPQCGTVHPRIVELERENAELRRLGGAAANRELVRTAYAEKLEAFAVRVAHRAGTAYGTNCVFEDWQEVFGTRSGLFVDSEVAFTIAALSKNSNPSGQDSPEASLSQGGEASGPVGLEPALEFAACTLCADVESPGFYTGCMIRDEPPREGFNTEGWSCNGRGVLARIVPKAVLGVLPQVELLRRLRTTLAGLQEDEALATERWVAEIDAALAGASERAVARAVSPDLIAEAICRLENAEPFLRGYPAGPLTVAHQNVEEALRFLRGTKPKSGNSQVNPVSIWESRARLEGDSAVGAGADLWMPALIATAAKLAFMARTSGGTAGRDEGLCAACDAVEALLPPGSLPYEKSGNVERNSDGVA